MNRTPNRVRFAVFSLSLLILADNARADEADWANNVHLPAGETAIELFDGNSFAGWRGLIDQYWSIENGVIIGKNDKPIRASTYLFTANSYRNFRLLLEVRQTIGPEYSTMHSDPHGRQWKGCDRHDRQCRDVASVADRVAIAWKPKTARVPVPRPDPDRKPKRRVTDRKDERVSAKSFKPPAHRTFSPPHKGTNDATSR